MTFVRGTPMVIKLDKARADALTVAIADELGRAQITYGCYVKLREANGLDTDALLPSEAAEKVYRHCGDGGLRAFITSEINKALRKEFGFVAKDKERPLGEYAPFTNQLEAAKALTERLKALPLRYRLTVQLPVEISEPLLPFLSSVKMSENVAIVAGNRISEDLPMVSPHSNIDVSLFSDFLSDGMDTSREIRSDRLYFTSHDVGYIRNNADSPIISQFQDRLRALLGALAATNFFDASYGFKSEKKPFVVVHSGDDEREILETHSLDDELWSGRYHRSAKKFVEKASDPASALRLALDRAAIVFGDDEPARRLFTASIWLYRAKQTSNPLDSLLQATVAIEVLLGDKDVADLVGLSRLLGNRCAYLLGTSRASRLAVMEEFTEIYKLRSSIVHSGKHRIDRKDRLVSKKCVELCSKVIAKELELHHTSSLSDQV
jgi:hypothetical protein